MNTWEQLLKEEKKKPYFLELLTRIRDAQNQGKHIYPKNKDIFNALNLTPFESIKVVIMGQDPYHGPNQAHGLCFSVQPGIKPPPSLMNIFNELERDLGFIPPNHGCLESWSKQGVLLLNQCLTVEAGKPGSHHDWGWSMFTEKILSLINQQRDGVIFLLWGSHAQKHIGLIDDTKHHILTTSHPSPLSAHRGFKGCKHFSKTNEILKNQGVVAIDWNL